MMAKPATTSTTSGTEAKATTTTAAFDAKIAAGDATSAAVLALRSMMLMAMGWLMEQLHEASLRLMHYYMLPELVSCFSLTVNNSLMLHC
jgi:hypothetical protein